MKTFSLSCLLMLFTPMTLPSAAFSSQSSAKAGASTSQSAKFIWWEAENFAAGDFPPVAQNPFRPFSPAEARALSGGAWIGLQGKREAARFLEYRVPVPADGLYHFWTRKFWKHGPFRFRFENGAWQNVGSEAALADSQSLRAFTGANWVYAGRVVLRKGTRLLRIELLENDGAAAFDCFVLSRAPFRPRGVLKPGQKFVSSERGWHAFQAPADNFQNARFDLRRLNHAFAGEFGFLRRDGERFTWQKKLQETARFWGVTAGEDVYRMEPEGMDYLARRLAKMGVNCVRLHLDWDETEPTSDKLRRIHRLVYALKREGIYTGLGSIVWPSPAPNRNGI